MKPIDKLKEMNISAHDNDFVDDVQWADKHPK